MADFVTEDETLAFDIMHDFSVGFGLANFVVGNAVARQKVGLKKKSRTEVTVD